jgi:hypothetical protein
MGLMVMGLGLDGFGVDFVILGVSADEPDEDAAGLVIDANDQAVGVALDVEDHAVIGQDVGVAVAILDVLKGAPISVASLVVPSLERSLGGRVGLPEIPQSLDGDDLHKIGSMTVNLNPNFPIWEV